jgi:hypothetical protein
MHKRSTTMLYCTKNVLILDPFLCLLPLLSFFSLQKMHNSFAYLDKLLVLDEKFSFIFKKKKTSETFARKA